ncbi:MAG: hypothetical protein WC749_02350 [Dehalococcoidia bacterium]
MAQWNSLKYKKKEVLTTLGDGINTGVPPFQIADSEATYMRNMDSREYPALSVRPGRTTYAGIASSSAVTLGQRNNETLMAVDGNTWLYWGSSTNAWMPLTTTLSATSTNVPKIFDFATGTNKYTLAFSPSTLLNRRWDGTSSSVTITDINCPNTNIVAVHKGRIYAARDNDIVYCALNVTTDWTTAGDAGTIDITRAKGPITAMTEYDDTVVVFTEFSMHELYGTGPTYYELVDVEGDIGCVSDRSLVRCGKRLYWLWYNGVYEYSGGSPIKISDPVKDYIEAIDFTYKAEITAGAIGDYLYISIPRDSIILKFDTARRKWFVDSGKFKDFATIGNALYGIDETGQCWNMRSTGVNDGTTPVSWEFITKPFTEDSIGGRKTLSEMYAVVDRSTSSTAFSVGYSTNVESNSSDAFTNITTTIPASSNIANTKIQLPLTALQNVNWYRLRFAGTGQATIHYLQKNLRVRDR